MSKTRVGVLRGGPSSEYEVSLKSGEHVLSALPDDKYVKHDIFIDREGNWHFKGVPISPWHVPLHVDVVFNALHGPYGEDGRVQQILDAIRIPYTGSGVFASSLSMNKALAKEVYRSHGLPTPRSLNVHKSHNIADVAQKIYDSTDPPWVIKPTSAGSSVGVTIARNFDEVVQGLETAFSHGDTAIVEEFIDGVEATCAVAEQADGNVMALPVIEIVPPDGSTHFDYTNKYDGSTQEICPARIDQNTGRAIENLATWAHRILGLNHYSRSDFIIVPRKHVYILETNSLPGLTGESLIIKALHAVDCPVPNFLDHLVTLALARG